MYIDKRGLTGTVKEKQLFKAHGLLKLPLNTIRVY